NVANAAHNFCAAHDAFGGGVDFIFVGRTAEGGQPLERYPPYIHIEGWQAAADEAFIRLKFRDFLKPVQGIGRDQAIVEVVVKVFVSHGDRAEGGPGQVVDVKELVSFAPVVGAF